MVLETSLYSLFNHPTWLLDRQSFNPFNAELIPICYLLALLGAHHILHVSRIRVNAFGRREEFHLYNMPIVSTAISVR
jgi:hypothetical protein